MDSYSNMVDFSDQCVIITGGAGVLGSEMALALYEHNANVVIIDLNLDNAQQVVERCKSSFKNRGWAMMVQANVLQLESFQNAVEIVLKEIGIIDFLINGAGGQQPESDYQ